MEEDVKLAPVFKPKSSCNDAVTDGNRIGQVTRLLVAWAMRFASPSTS